MRLAPLFVLLSFSACAVQQNVGELTREDRSVDSFSRIDASGMFDVEVDVGGPEAVSILCGARVLEDILTRVDSTDTLTISVRSGSRWSNVGQCEVHVRVPELAYASSAGSGDMDIDGATGALHTLRSEGSGNILATGTAMALERIDADGSGRIEVDGIDTPSVDIALEGSGDIEVVGQAGFADVRVDGSGDIDAVDLIAVDADIRVQGSGSVSLTVTGSADVTLTGSGDILLHGNPQVTRNVSGSGNVRVN